MENDKCDEQVMIELPGSVELEIDQGSNAVLVFDRVRELSVDVVD